MTDDVLWQSVTCLAGLFNSGSFEELWSHDYEFDVGS